MEKGIVNVPNALSAYRIVMAPVLGILAWSGARDWFSWLLLASLVTDMADGFIARRWKLHTKLGAQLDSVGDALTFLAAIAGAWRFESDFFYTHKAFVLAAFVPYVLQILLAIFVYGRPSSFHTYLAKVAALLQGVFLLGLFFFGPWMWLFYLAVTVTILEILEEIVLLYFLPRWKTDVKGLYWVLKNRKRGGVSS